MVLHPRIVYIDMTHHYTAKNMCIFMCRGAKINAIIHFWSDSEKFFAAMMMMYGRVYISVYEERVPVVGFLYERSIKKKNLRGIFVCLCKDVD